MEPFFAGTAARRLFAVFHAGVSPPQGEDAPAVLVCAPHGQEGVRSHRLWRVLAERLARAGCDVLRFDPYGSGDSAGDDEELEWSGWLGDVQRASAELARRSAGRPQVWVGARLGATAACAALQGAGDGPAAADVPPPRALVLCEPVLDGPAYLRSLAQATVRALEASCSIKDPAWRRTLQDEPAVFEREAVGFALGEELHEALRRLAPGSLQAPRAASVCALVAYDDAPLREAAQRWQHAGCRVSVEVVPFHFDWTAEEALNTAIVPHELLQALEARVMPAPAAFAP